MFAITTVCSFIYKIMSFLLQNIQVVFGALRLSYSMGTGDKAAGTLSRPITSL